MTNKEIELRSALEVTLKALNTYGEHPIISAQANKALRNEPKESERGITITKAEIEQRIRKNAMKHHDLEIHPSVVSISFVEDLLEDILSQKSTINVTESEQAEPKSAEELFLERYEDRFIGWEGYSKHTKLKHTQFDGNDMIDFAEEFASQKPKPTMSQDLIYEMLTHNDEWTNHLPDTLASNEGMVIEIAKSIAKILSGFNKDYKQ